MLSQARTTAPRASVADSLWRLDRTAGKSPGIIETSISSVVAVSLSLLSPCHGGGGGGGGEGRGGGGLFVGLLGCVLGWESRHSVFVYLD